MLAPLPGCTTLVPGSATIPFFGVVPAIVDDAGEPVPVGKGGRLVIKQPWPSMLRGVWGDSERYQKQYWSAVPGAYLTGDGARIDEQGNYWIMGRIDDVVNVSGHRLSTMEIESALVSHPHVSEAAVVSRPDHEKGEAIIAFVTLTAETKASDVGADQLKEHVAQSIGALARPSEVHMVATLPKTRSGKIMRRVLRATARGEAVSGDLSTMED